MTRAGDALIGLQRMLAAATASAALDAEVLLAEVLGCSRSELAARSERELSRAQSQRLETLAQRRLAGEPVAYLTGRREFWSLDLEVNRDVLVPRPETELLVDLALASLRDIARPEVLDLGTGSGAIALAIASERPDALVTAVDASGPALTVAARNAARLGVGNVRCLQGSWYGAVVTQRFHAIVANPPYVADDDPHLATLAHEPRSALVAGPQGLDALTTICAGAVSHLHDPGVVIVEHGSAQGPAVRALFAANRLSRIETFDDLAGLPRATRGTHGQ